MDSPDQAHVGAKDVTDRFYRSLASGDSSALRESLDPDFVLSLSPGLPVPAARVQRGRDAAIANVWGRLPAGLALTCEPGRTIVIGDEELIVFGHYRGADWRAPFVHFIYVRDGVLLSLRQLTDTRCWPAMSAHAPASGRTAQTSEATP